MEPIWVALIVAIGALLTTAATTLLNALVARQSKAQDYERQDAVAEQVASAARKAAKAAELLVASNETVAEQAAKTAKVLLASNAQVAKQTASVAEVTNGKLNQIHELVNSNMTTQMQEVYTSLMQQLVLMREVVALHKAAGREPSEDATKAIETIERRLTELGGRLYGRAVATEVADSKLHN